MTGGWYAISGAVLRYLLGFVFIYAGYQKLQQPFLFLSTVFAYRPIAPWIAISVGYGLPWIEVVVGTCLFTGAFLYGSLLVSCGLSALFVSAQAWALAKGLSISCGCFSPTGSDLVSYATLLRTVAILCVSLLLFGSNILKQNDKRSRQ